MFSAALRQLDKNRIEDKHVYSKVGAAKNINSLRIKRHQVIISFQLILISTEFY